MYRAICPSCQQQIQYTDQHLGQVVNCPTCSTPLQLPATAPQPAPAAPPAPPATTDLFGQVGQSDPLAGGMHPGPPVQHPPMQRSGRPTNRKRRSGNWGWQRWAMIGGIATIVLCLGVLAFMLLTPSSKTPKAVFAQWKKAIVNDNYEKLYDLLTKESQQELMKVLERGGARAGRQYPVLADLEGRDLFAALVRIADSTNVVVTSTPNEVTKLRCSKHKTAEIVETEYSDDKKTAKVIFKFDEKKYPAPVKSKTYSTKMGGKIQFNYLDLVKVDGSWKIKGIDPALIVITNQGILVGDGI